MDRARRSSENPETRRGNAVLRARPPVSKHTPSMRRVETWFSEPLLVTVREVDALEILLGNNEVN